MEIEKLPIYKLYLAKPTIEVSRATQEQVAEYSQKHNEFMAQTGGKILIAADMVWSSEEYATFGIEEFPNLEALIEFHDCLKTLDWFSYFTSKSYLGISVDYEGQPVPFVLPPPPEPGTKPIYKVFLTRPTALYYDDPKGMMELAQKIEEAGKKAGMVQVLAAYMRIYNEEWMSFGLERYPGLPAFTEKYYLMEKLGWYKYMQAKAYLGIATDGLLMG